MSYLFNTPDDRRAMLGAIGVDSIEDLFAQLVPEESRFHGELNLPPALTEWELTRHLTALAAQNVACSQAINFLGAGSYDHFIPAAVDALASRGEFYTSYTPYQPEVSQGNLAVSFEYQSFVTRLTGMDVANASLYDGGTAAAEAVLMAIHATGREGRVVVCGGVHPEYRDTIRTYLTNLGVELVTVAAPYGVVSPADVAAACDDRTACVVVQQPNFFGCLEDIEAIGRAAHEAGAVFCVSADPISLGLLKRPGDYGADVVTAEGQSLGNPLHYGGPYLGIIACKEQFVRRMPGRIAGQTLDRRGKRCWVLTLQTREQHIRREKATSNICTNQGLFALRAAIYLALLGPHGLRETAELCARKAHYARRELTSAGSRLAQAFAAPAFKEFVVRDVRGDVADLLAAAEAEGYFAGVPLGRWYPDLEDCFLVCVTEKRSKDEIDGLAATLRRSTAEA